MFGLEKLFRGISNGESANASSVPAEETGGQNPPAPGGDQEAAANLPRQAQATRETM